MFKNLICNICYNGLLITYIYLYYKITFTILIINKIIIMVETFINELALECISDLGIDADSEL